MAVYGRESEVERDVWNRVSEEIFCEGVQKWINLHRPEMMSTQLSALTTSSFKLADAFILARRAHAQQALEEAQREDARKAQAEGDLLAKAAIEKTIRDHAKAELDKLAMDQTLAAMLADHAPIDVEVIEP